MAKSETTVALERAIYKQTKKLGVFGCFEVTIGWYGKERVDYMTLDTKGVFRCYEVKASVSDFRSKAKKTFVGHFNYFVLTDELYEKVKNEVPSHVGVYVYGRLVKRAKKQELTILEDVLKNSLVRSLSREAHKVYESENPLRIVEMERRIAYYKRENDRLRRENRDFKRNRL